LDGLAKQAIRRADSAPRLDRTKNRPQYLIDADINRKEEEENIKLGWFYINSLLSSVLAHPSC
jgi:hypothetical protein